LWQATARVSTIMIRFLNSKQTQTKKIIITIIWSYPGSSWWMGIGHLCSSRKNRIRQISWMLLDNVRALTETKHLRCARDPSCPNRALSVCFEEGLQRRALQFDFLVAIRGWGSSTNVGRFSMETGRRWDGGGPWGARDRGRGWAIHVSHWGRGGAFLFSQGDGWGRGLPRLPQRPLRWGVQVLHISQDVPYKGIQIVMHLWCIIVREREKERERERDGGRGAVEVVMFSEGKWFGAGLKKNLFFFCRQLFSIHFQDLFFMS